jgi:hypothetical protein
LNLKSGLIPFVTSTAIPFFDRLSLPLIMDVQCLYSSVILSFMGAVHWGIAMQADHDEGTLTNVLRYSLSTVPSLLAFFSVLLTPTHIALLIQAGGFACLLIADIFASYRGFVPNWYPSLRIILTSVVVGCIFTLTGLCYQEEVSRKEEIKRLDKEMMDYIHKNQPKE